MTPDIAELRREAAELRARVETIEDEVAILREKADMLAEHSVTLTFIKEHISEVKTSVVTFNEQISQLRIDNAVLTKKVAWIVGGVTAAAGLVAKHGADWVKALGDLFK